MGKKSKKNAKKGGASSTQGPSRPSMAAPTADQAVIEEARLKADNEAKQVAEALKKAQEQQARLLKAEQEAKVAKGVHRAKERVRLQKEQDSKDAAEAAQRVEEQARRKADTLARFSSPPKSAKKASAAEEAARLLRAVQDGSDAIQVIKKAEQDAKQGVPSSSPIAKRDYGAKSPTAYYGAKSPNAATHVTGTSSPAAKKAEEHTKANVETLKATKTDMEAISAVPNGVASPEAKHAKSNVEISKVAKMESEANNDPAAKKMAQHTKVETEISKMAKLDEEKQVHADDDGVMLKVEEEKKKTDADYLTEDANAFGEELLRKAEEEARKAAEDRKEPVIETSRVHEDTEEEITSNGGRHVSSATNVSPASAGLRWLVLAAICLVMSSTAYSYDIPSALHAQLQDYMEDHSKQQFELEFSALYTVYSIPNIILPFIGGALVDQLGASFMIPMFASFCVVGQFIFTLGTARKHWRLMLLGRIVYGLGGESTYVACSTVLSEWFAGKEMAFAFGLAMALCKMGSVFNNLLSPVVAESKTTPSALWLGLGVNVGGLILGVLIYCLDRNFRKIPRPIVVDGNDDSLTEPLLPGNGTETEVPDFTPLEASSTYGTSRILGRITRMSSLFWLLSLSCLVVYGCVIPFNNVASAILLERNYFKTPPDDCQLLFPNECTSGTLQDHPNPSTDSNGQSCPGNHYAPVLPTSLNITHTGRVYDKVSLSHVQVDCEVSFWSHGCTRDYCEASDRASVTADRVMSIPYIVSAVISPVLGGMVDKVGKRAFLAFLAPLVLIMVHMTLALSDASPLLPLLGQGLSYALFGAVLWPSVPLTVEPSLAGTAFGIINSIQNIGLGVFPLVVAGIHNQSGQYLPHVEYFFCACAFMGCLVGIWLNLIDRKHGNKLNSVDGKGDDFEESSPSPARGAVEELNNVSEIV